MISKRARVYHNTHPRAQEFKTQKFRKCRKYRGSNISMTLKNCGELSTVPQFIYCFFAFYCNKDSWYVGHDTWLACQRSRVRFREETFFLARKNLRNLRTLTSESILEILAPMQKMKISNSVKNGQFSTEY